MARTDRLGQYRDGASSSGSYQVTSDRLVPGCLPTSWSTDQSKDTEGQQHPEPDHLGGGTPQVSLRHPFCMVGIKILITTAEIPRWG